MENSVIPAEGRWKKIIVGLIPIVMSVFFFLALYIFGSSGVDGIQSQCLFNAGYDVMAMLLAIILFACGILDRTQSASTRRAFFTLLIIDFCAMTADSISYFLDATPECRNAQLFCMFVAYASDYLLYYLVVLYIMKLLDLDSEKFCIILRRVFAVPCFLLSALTVLNFFMPVYYWVDENGVYSTGPLDTLNACFKGVITILFVTMAIVYRKRLRLYQIVALLGYSLAVAVMVIVDVYAEVFYLDYGVILLLVFIMYIILNLEAGNKGAVTRLEFDTAKKIQASILPNLFPDFVDVPEFEIYALMTPAREVGGDFYDFFMLDENRIAFLVGDVTSHDVGGALFMAVSKAMIKMRAQAGGSPAEVIRDVDAKLGKDNDLGMFVTVWLGYLDLTTGHVVACNAGHDFPALSLRSDERSKGGTYFVEESEHGPAVGLIPGMEFPEIEFDMEPGDKIFLYTDGVNEAQGKDAVQFDIDRLLAVLNENREKRSEEICCQVKEAVDAFVGKDPQFDDMTMMALTFRGYRREGLRMIGSILVDASEDALDEINEFLGGKLSETSFDPNVQFQLELAVEEIFVNIFSYAYEDPDEEMKASPLFGKVEVSCEIQSEPAEITLSFRDGGRAFNPLEAQEADTSGEMFLEKEGGFGIHMVKETMDEVTYERKDGANVLTIRKKL